jgi:hypothetical protein
VGWFSKKRKQKEREELMDRLCEKPIKYVARRQIKADGSTEEIVLGKGGRLSRGNGFMMVDTGNGEVFRCPEEEARCAELLSRDGAVVQGVNTHTGQEDTVVAYYVYYR